jgi:hypothetical protein
MFFAQLKLFAALLATLAPQPEREIVRQCYKRECAAIILQDNVVKYREGAPIIRAYDIGLYVPEAQKWVPNDEAPLREMTMPNKWRAVVSAALDQYGLGLTMAATIRLRVFDPNGKSQLKYDGNSDFDDIEMGKLFGTPDVVLSFQTDGESVSMQDGEIWLIPNAGKPKKILHVSGNIRRFQPSGSGASGIPGVWVVQEMYNGIDPATRGQELQFWRWDTANKSLSRVSDMHKM